MEKSLAFFKKIIPRVSAAMIIGFFAVFVVPTAFAFTDATANPPGSNVATPLNVSASDQTKTGGMLQVFNLWVNSALGVTGGIAWGGNGSSLTTDKGGSIELGGDSNHAGSQPYIDFHYTNLIQDYNTRIISWRDRELSFLGGTADNSTGSPYLNVGIGVSNPGAALDVYGSIRTGNGHLITNHPNGALVLDAGPSPEGMTDANKNEANQAGIWFRRANNRGYGDASVNDDPTSNQAGAYSGGYTNLARITEAGNMGIGTVAPEFGRLQIAHWSVPLAFVETDGTAGNPLQTRGSLWRMPLDGAVLRFDATQNGVDFTDYATPLAMNAYGDVKIGNGSLDGFSTKQTDALRVNGSVYATSFTATTKKFDIIDPRYGDEKRRLVHGVLEGPEHAVFYRGEAQLQNGKAIIQLPDYFEALTGKDGRTVLLTNLDGGDVIWVKTQNGTQVKDGKFVVVSANTDSNQHFNWEVKAVRSDVEPLKPEVVR